MTLTQEQRDDLRRELDANAALQKPIAEKIKPFTEQLRQLEEARELILVNHGLIDEPHTCEGCLAFILPGDKYHATRDAGWLCETCAPTFADMKAHLAERAASYYGDEDPEDTANVAAVIDQYLAGGGDPNAKVVCTCEE